MRMRIFILLTLLISFSVNAPSAGATVPRLLAWQGVALDSLDVPLANGTYMFSFSIWSASDGGDSVWGESRVIDVENGVLNVLLGDSISIADSVFDMPNRWLQVQFESEAPYEPRTRIASVGYAYRVGSLDGASGGEVSSNVDLKAMFTVPKFRVFREGTSTVIGEMTGGGPGGRVTLYNGTGGKIIELDPSADDGGQLVLWTHPTNSTGIVMENTGNDNPYLLMQGQSAGLVLNMDSVGDPSVILPPSAISNTEILDEPGIATDHNSSFITLTGTMQDLATVTISIPAPGYIVLEGKCYGLIDGSLNMSRGLVQIDETSGGSLTDPYWTVYGFDAGTTTSTQYYPVYVTRTYFKTSPGSYAFRMEGLSSSAGGTNVRAAKSFLTATYFPKAYGVVTAVASSQEAGDFATAVPINSTGLDGTSTATAAGYEVDLRELELRAERAQEAADAARIELLGAKLKARAEESPRENQD